MAWSWFNESDRPIPLASVSPADVAKKKRESTSQLQEHVKLRLNEENQEEKVVNVEDLRANPFQEGEFETEARGIGLSLSSNHDQSNCHTAARVVQKNRYKRIELDCNQIKSNFNTREESVVLEERNEVIRVLVTKNESSVRISVHNTNQECKHNSERQISQSRYNSEANREVMQEGSVQTRFYLRNCAPNCLVLSAIERWKCRDELILGEFSLNQHKEVTRWVIPGPATQLNIEQLSAGGSLLFCRLKELLADVFDRRFASYSQVP